MKLQAVQRRAPDGDAPRAAPAAVGDLHVRIVAALRPEFASEVIVPAVGAPIIGLAPCVVEGCVAGTTGHELCRDHLARWTAAGRPDKRVWAATQTPLDRPGTRPLIGCEVPACRRGAAQERLCVRHAEAYRRAGSPARGRWLMRPHELPGDDALDCVMPGCVLFAENRRRALCRQHTIRWSVAGKPAVAQFATVCQQLPEHAFDLRGLAPRIRLEIQYGLQCRVDQGRIKTNPVRLRPLFTRLARSGAGSLQDHTIEQWRELLTRDKTLTRGLLSFLAFTLDSLEDLQHGVGWESEYPRDVWRLRRLGYDSATLAHLRFDTIEPVWLRELTKRWLRWRLSTGLSVTQAGKDVTGVRRFAEFLVAIDCLPASPAGVTRELIERYLAWLSIKRPAAAGRGGELAALGGFLRAVQQHRWADDLPATATIYAEDYPRREEAPSRALSEHVMRQLESEANLYRFVEPRFRLLTELLQRGGLRVGDARQLPIDCIRRDEHGAPYLQYRNHKMRRIAFIPIDDVLEAAITTQQTAVRSRWPAGRVLFPMIYANPDGQRPISRAAYAVKLKKWLLECDIRNESQIPVRVTPHQFRHTYATRLMNLDVPPHVVQKLLDHDSPAMTAHYGRLKQETIRRHWDAAMKVGVAGDEVTVDTTGPLADAVWLKNSLSRAKMALPNGYCTLPLQQTCDYANACLTCPMFLTTAEFLPQHRQQLTDTRQLLHKAEQVGQQRVIQMNQTVERNLLAIITTLDTGATDHPGPAPKCGTACACSCTQTSGTDDAR